MSWLCPSCETLNENDSIIRCTCGHELIDNHLNNNENGIKKRKKTGFFWGGIFSSIVLGIYCLMGVAMTGSFSVASPEKKEHFLTSAYLYLTGFAFCVIMVWVFGYFIFKARRKQ